MKRLSTEQDEINVVADQFGVPTSNTFIAEQIKAIIPQLTENNTGVYHMVPYGSCSWYEFAKEIISQTNIKFNLKNLHPIATDEFPTKTKRPSNSILSNAKIKQTFNLNFNNWSYVLEKVVHE